LNALLTLFDIINLNCHCFTFYSYVDLS